MTLLPDAPTMVRTAKTDAGIRSLLVHVEASPEAAPRLDVAVDLARKWDATLVGLGAEMFQTQSDPYGMLGGEWVVELQRLTEDSLKRIHPVRTATAAEL